MSKKITDILFVIGLSLMIISCVEKNDNRQLRLVDKKQMKEEFEQVNKNIVKKEIKDIDDYIKERNLDMVKTGTGLRYRIVNQGERELIQPGNIVVLDYEVRLLNGDLVYSSAENGKKVFVAGHGGVESGLEEAVLYLHKGDEAEVIIPSYLAHGLIGDGDKIPPLTPIIYNMKVIENQSNK